MGEELLDENSMNSIELITLLVTIAVTPPPKPIAPFFVNGFR